MPMATPLRKRLALMSIIVYWPAIFFLTHTPLPRVVYQANLSDKNLHFMVYFILVFLLWGTLKPYSKVSWNKPTVWIILTVTVWYGVVDEWLQGFVHGRTADVHDFLADLAGTVSSLVVLSILSFWPALLMMSAMVVFVCVNSTRANITQLLPIISTCLNPILFACFTGLTSYCVKTSRIIIINHVSEGFRGYLPFLLPVVLLLVVQLGAYMLDRQVTMEDCLLSWLAIVITALIGQNAQKLLDIARK